MIKQTHLLTTPDGYRWSMTREQACELELIEHTLTKQARGMDPQLLHSANAQLCRSWCIQTSTGSYLAGSLAKSSKFQEGERHADIPDICCSGSLRRQLLCRGEAGLKQPEYRPRLHSKPDCYPGSGSASGETAVAAQPREQTGEP